MTMHHAIEKFILYITSEGLNDQEINFIRLMLVELEAITGDIPINQLDPNQVQQFIGQGRDNGLKADEIISNDLALDSYKIVQWFLDWASERGFIQDRQTILPDPSKAELDFPGVLTDEELSYLYDYLVKQVGYS